MQAEPLFPSELFPHLPLEIARDELYFQKPYYSHSNVHSDFPLQSLQAFSLPAVLIVRCPTLTLILQVQLSCYTPEALETLAGNLVH